MKVVGIVVVCLLAAVTLGSGVVAHRGDAAEKPNIVLINLDDVEFDLFDDPALDAYFPNMRTLLRDQGLRLNNLHVTTPLCGPARASLFRGQYAHNTNVLSNDPDSGFAGGFGEFYDNGYATDEIGLWMKDAGYRTMMIGKYHHRGFPSKTADQAYVPPGWDDFYHSYRGYYEWLQKINGVDQPVTAPYPDEFRTDVERDQAVSLLQQHAPGAEPLFLYVAPFTAHRGPLGNADPIYAARHANLFANAQIPRTPDFNETDTSDKTPQYRQFSLYGSQGVANLDDTYRDRLRAMMSVDEMVGEFVDELQSLGELDNTYIMVTSDNGMSLGHHRVDGKNDPFDRSTRVGMLVRGPGIPAGTEADHLLGHIDITPTLVELAGGAIPAWVDGRSFASILADPLGAPPTAGRSWLLIENWEPKTTRNVVLDSHFRAIRTGQLIYVEWANGDREWYDLAADPYQLDNIYDAQSGFAKVFASAVMQILGDCQGPGCRPTGATNPPPDTVLTSPADPSGHVVPLTVSGTASDDTGVANVDVIVRARKSSLYWNGTSLQSQIATLPATLASPGATTTTFSTSLTLPDIDVDITARARDVDGTTDDRVDVAIVRGSPDTTTPDATLLYPAPGSTTSGLTTIAGAAFDDIGVDEVQILLRNDTTGRYWNGTAWQDDYVRFPAAANHTPATLYVYSVTLPPGAYYTAARVFDLSGNYDTTPPASSFTVS